MASLSPPAPADAPAASEAYSPRAVLLALVISLLLTVAWTVKDFAALSIGRLPDNDDMMRIAEVRDWLGGQAFNDLLQYRLGPGEGASMHWSRIADAGPALLLQLLTPLLGARTAELAMVIAYPAILFFLYLLVMARIGRRLIGEGSAPVVVIVAALAFPTVSLFVPGRIDHHGLQIVLMLLLVERLVAPPSLRGGLVAGFVAALSLAIGLEAAPEIVAAMAALFALWLGGGHGEDRRAGGFAVGLLGVTAGLLAFARPRVWPEIWCDGFTPASASATIVAGCCWAGLALAGLRLTTPKARLAVGAAVGAAGLLIIFRTSSVCFTGPYGALDPFLKRVWMANVGEAGGLFTQQLIGTIVAYGGLCLVGLAVGLYRFATIPESRPRWAGFTIFLVLGVIAAILQIRVTYIMAALAALPVAALLVAVRGRVQARQGSVAGLLGAWLLATGFVYNAVGNSIDAVYARPGAVQKTVLACTKGRPFQQIAAMAPGTVIAPLDSGAYLIGMTPHRVLAAPYHRNNIGNLAMYRFFLSPPERARTIAAEWQADYVAICPSSFKELLLEREGPNSLAGQLLAGTVPAWLEPVPLDGHLKFYKIR